MSTENVKTPVPSGSNGNPMDPSDIAAAEGRRLYIGNLAYDCQEETLKTEFHGYTLERVSIPVNPRSNRPVGYAFIELPTAAEADRAITELNGATILDRKISVQLARQPNTAARDEEGGETKRRSATRTRGGRGRGRGGARGGRGNRSEGRKDDAENGATTDEHADGTAHGAGEDATNGTGSDVKAGNADGQDGAVPTHKPRGAPRPPKQRGPPEGGIPSKTKVMVANLPYDLDEEKLLDLFKDYNPKAAKIAFRPIPRFMVKKLLARNEPRKGRGFGFVTLETEELQQKACEEMNGKEVEGREIAVKVAIDSPGKEDDDESGAATTTADGQESTPAAVVSEESVAVAAAA